MMNHILLQKCHSTVNQVLSLQCWKRIEWMGRKASSEEAYSPTHIEQIANVGTHSIGILPSILALLTLLERSCNGPQTLSAFVYGATLIFLFVVSTAFHCICHCSKHCQAKDVLHRCDRAMIYVFIAGSYFPWLTIYPFPVNGWAGTMKWFVWILAGCGVLYQQICHEKYKKLETCFYLIMGVGPALPLIVECEFQGMAELKMGGVLYILGIIFFKSDGRIPFAHAIWHLFVLMAATVHYYAILNYLYSPQ